ncbi:hypothetical protein B0H14DRAFT_2629987 [Mycena olivaceomarginata]|nr:hypothetical protein B0H14DRAFT_2629987 [Mycena olivaceomarginata]
MSPDVRRTPFPSYDNLEDPFHVPTNSEDYNGISRRRRDLFVTSTEERLLSTRTQLNSWNPAVAEATHESLMSIRNLQYIKLYDAHGNLLGRFQEAQQAYGELQIRYDTLNRNLRILPAMHIRLSSLQSPIDSLLLPAHTLPQQIHLMPLSRPRLPPITSVFSYRATTAKLITGPRATIERRTSAGRAKKARRACLMLKHGAARKDSEDDENVMFWFIEDEDGNSIPGQRAKAARDQARKIWRYLDRSGRLPDCWNEADTVASSYYNGEMRCFFPELQLCENDYKANRIATLIFPNFLKHRNSKVKEEIKEDSEDADNAAAAVVAGKKRAASEAPDDEPASKRTPVSRHTPAVKPRPKPKPKKKTPSVPAPAAPSATPEPVSVVSASVPPAPAPATTQPAPPSPPAAPSPPAPPPQPAPTSQPSQPVLPSQPAPSAAGVPSLLITTSVSAPPALALALLSSVAVASATGLSTGTNDNDLEPAIMDNISHHANTSGPPTAAVPVSATPQATVPAAGPSTSRVENPLAFLGDPKGPTTRAEFVAGTSGGGVKKKPGPRSNKTDQQSGDSTKTVILHKSNAKTARGLCLQDYIRTYGSVPKQVFDTYFNSLLPADLKIWEERSAAAKQAEKKAAT